MGDACIHEYRLKRMTPALLITIHFRKSDYNLHVLLERIQKGA